MALTEIMHFKFILLSITTELLDLINLIKDIFSFLQTLCFQILILLLFLRSQLSFPTMELHLALGLYQKSQMLVVVPVDSLISHRPSLCPHHQYRDQLVRKVLSLQGARFTNRDCLLPQYCFQMTHSRHCFYNFDLDHHPLGPCCHQNYSKVAIQNSHLKLNDHDV